ncbi:MAG: short-chain dehydrogenase/reductase [Hyphomicrobiales bacterium]|jgi:NAD(P)-dependent dehydrogenase (short-subunit alcohol dehydrogenase family)|nr:short-chain dehydrogenase/reductase [Hyphomicrobiales bacterium]
MDRMGLGKGGRNALVTGAARRIGGAIALRLAADGFGVALHTSARSAPEAQARADEISRAGGRACVVVADLGSPEEVGRLMTAASGALGPVQALVNSASIYEPDGPAAFDPAFFDRLMAVNLRAPLQLAADLAAQLPGGHAGAIVNITDQKVWRLNPRYFTYTIGKSALWTATQTMAQAYAPRIRVNAVGPGPVAPNQVEGMAGFLHEAAAIPLGASIEPEEVAEAVLYLVNARSVTGQMIAVDGGQHLAWKTPDVPA